VAGRGERPRRKIERKERAHLLLEELTGDAHTSGRSSRSSRHAGGEVASPADSKVVRGLSGTTRAGREAGGEARRTGGAAGWLEACRRCCGETERESGERNEGEGTRGRGREGRRGEDVVLLLVSSLCTASLPEHTISSRTTGRTASFRTSPLLHFSLASFTRSSPLASFCRTGLALS
jgi:hypothetical protein